VLTEDFCDARNLTGADEEVHLRQFAGQIFRVTLRKATSDDQFLEFTFLLKTRYVENRIDGFFLGRTDKAAGVHQDHVGVRRLLDHLVAVILQQARHDLGVHQIARATEAHDAELFIWSVHCPNSTTSAPCGISTLNRSSVSPRPCAWRKNATWSNYSPRRAR
jgi:hypothetical protein